MSKYSEEIVKQAEELIEKQTSAVCPREHEEGNEWGEKFYQKILNLKGTRKRAILAAIVSCEFAMRFIPDERDHILVEYTKKYLEELL